MTISVLKLDRFDFDQAYVERLVAGDPETEQHFAKYFGDLLTIKLRSRLRSPAQAEDARQETFRRVLTTLKQRGGLKAAEHLGAFVNGVCNNVLFEQYRAGSRTDPLADEVDPADESRPSVESGMMAAEKSGRTCNTHSRPCLRRKRTSCAGCSSRNETKTRFAPSWGSIGTISGCSSIGRRRGFGNSSSNGRTNTWTTSKPSRRMRQNATC